MSEKAKEKKVRKEKKQPEEVAPPMSQEEKALLKQVDDMKVRHEKVNIQTKELDAILGDYGRMIDKNLSSYPHQTIQNLQRSFNEAKVKCDHLSRVASKAPSRAEWNEDHMALSMR